MYVPEYGLNETFVDAVTAGVERALAAGWPERGGGVWIVQHDGAVRGSLGLTDAGDGLGHVRWFALEPQLRGRGLGRQLIGELLDPAAESGMRRLELGTFSALTTAAGSTAASASASPASMSTRTGDHPSHSSTTHSISDSGTI